jgi:predicted RNA-binding protein
MLVGGIELLNHRDVLSFYERIVTAYSPPEGKDIALFLPCSAKKPYSLSRTHRAVRKRLEGLEHGKRVRIHELIVSEPLGIVPREYEEVYPAAHYDMVLGSWFPTGNIPNARRVTGNDIVRIRASAKPSGVEREVINTLGARVAEFLRKTRSSYRHRIGFVRSSQRAILEKASSLSGVSVDFALDQRFVSELTKKNGTFYWIMNGLRCEESLNTLERKLSELR